jgi:protein transport protein SEC13
MIHDSQFDYYAKKLATCSSDATIKIFEVANEKYHLSATLTGSYDSCFLINFNFIYFEF